MPRPTTRAELLASAEREFVALMDAAESFPPAARTAPVDIDDQSRCPRDVLAHLHEWHLLLERWYAEGMAGEHPAIPALGYTWKDTPALNAELWARHAHTSYDEAAALLRASHARVLAIARAHDDEELFTKKRYAWTGSTSLGSYLVSTLSSHYEWGRKTLKRIAKAGVPSED